MDAVLLALGIGHLLGLVSIPSVLLRRQGRPLAALAWVVALLGLPWVAVIAWWWLARSYMLRERSTRRRHGEQFEEVGVSEGNAVELLDDAQPFLHRMEWRIREAEHHVHVQFFEWYVDGTGERFRDLLVERARAGVQVRLLLDGMGSRRALGRHLDPLRQAGARVASFLPLWPWQLGRALNLRNHRKIVVVDGRVALTGGLNIGTPYARDYHDVGMEVRGPAVCALQELFASDWAYTTGEVLETTPSSWSGEASCAVIGSGPHHPFNATKDALFVAISRARHRVWICSPFVVLPGPIRYALRGAALRGLDVRVLTQRQPDVRLAHEASWAWYPDLVQSGVRIFEYAPRLLHAKMALFDDELVLLGSANTDTRSFRLNFEASCLVRDPGFAGQVRALFEQDFEDSVEIGPDDLQIGVLRRLGQSAAHLLSPLL